MTIPLSGTEADQPVAEDALDVKRVLMFLAEGFEDAEAVCAIDVAGWTHYRPSIATVELDITGFHDIVRGGFGTSIPIDIGFDDVDPAAYDALIVPGGFHNRGFDEAYDERLRRLVREMRALGCPIATMCVGVLPVAEAGVLNGGTAVTYALSSRHDNAARLRDLGCTVSDEPVAEWDGIISSSGPAYSDQVMHRLLELVAGPRAAAEAARYRSGSRDCAKSPMPVPRQTELPTHT